LLASRVAVRLLRGVVRGCGLEPGFVGGDAAVTWGGAADWQFDAGLRRRKCLWL
jgi:hypothetical protein